ncbi:MarR family transcriptional regulator [Ruthenibacterium sp. CLA-JM-H11]|uniref:HTH-type transcriptional regulator SarZ n=1 Tax=Ruthenibacterium intestinale TaxID=3133163 RepID=A0ABV1GFI8_9FIRM
MTSQQEMLNRFLVDVFGDILRLEEASLRKHCPNLSVTELHVLEAVAACAGENGAGMAVIASSLGVTAGTATVSVKTLEQKGYLARTRAMTDRRRVFVTLTEKAYPVLRQHALFHQRMVEQVSNTLPNDQLDTLCQALETLHSYFLSSR